MRPRKLFYLFLPIIMSFGEGFLSSSVIVYVFQKSSDVITIIGLIILGPILTIILASGKEEKVLIRSFLMGITIGYILWLTAFYHSFQ